MGFFSKLWKGPEVDLEKSGENAKKMRQMFDRVVENGGEYRLISGYTMGSSTGAGGRWEA